jgi:mercuric ion binding protein
MKLITFLLTICLFCFGFIASAKKETNTVKVYGNCGMCKTRIEKAAKDAGATKAEWNEDSKMLTVQFKSGKTSIEKIQEQVALVGHDTGSFKATESVYESLPGCCKYDRSGKPSTGH